MYGLTLQVNIRDSAGVYLYAVPLVCLPLGSKVDYCSVLCRGNRLCDDPQSHFVRCRMFGVLTASIEWMPLILRLPLLALVALLFLIVLVKLVSAVLSIISAVLSFITGWL